VRCIVADRQIGMIVRACLGDIHAESFVDGTQYRSRFAGSIGRRRVPDLSWLSFSGLLMPPKIGLASEHS
jgi:hypothetical protein